MLFCMIMPLLGFAQEETRIVDSLQNVLASQQGRDKVLTMIELTWDFYDISFDDCIDWGEKAIAEAQRLQLPDLEAKANYVLGIQYAYHSDLDLARHYLQAAYRQFDALDDTKNAFESLWNIASYELAYGSMDSANHYYENALDLALIMSDSSAAAYVMANIAIIHYRQKELGEAVETYQKVRRIAKSIGMGRMAMQAESNLATLYVESGRVDEAKTTLHQLIPKLQAENDAYLLVTACKTMGNIFGFHQIDYDSAMYYLKLSMDYADAPAAITEDLKNMRMYKSDVLSDMAKISFLQGIPRKALQLYDEALQLAEAESYLSGQMTAFLGLGTVYAVIGEPSKSLKCLGAYSDLEAKSGITMMHSATKLPLILDYARLGRYDDLEKMVSDIDDERASLFRENADLFERNIMLEETVADLTNQHKQQSQTLESLQSQVKQCKLAFFGLLALLLAASLFALILAIVRKKSSKSVN